MALQTDHSKDFFGSLFVCYDTRMTKEAILEFLKQHSLAVIATVNEQGAPQAAVVEFAELSDLTIIIDTLTYSRKYKNLQSNSEAAIVIGWDADKTLQIDAIASELSGPDLERAKQVYFVKNERARKWESHPGIAYFAFKPTWLRYSNVGVEPWIVEEMSLPA